MKIAWPIVVLLTLASGCSGGELGSVVIDIEYPDGPAVARPMGGYAFTATIEDTSNGEVVWQATQLPDNVAISLPAGHFRLVVTAYALSDDVNTDVDTGVTTRDFGPPLSECELGIGMAAAEEVVVHLQIPDGQRCALAAGTAGDN